MGGVGSGIGFGLSGGFFGVGNGVPPFRAGEIAWLSSGSVAPGVLCVGDGCGDGAGCGVAATVGAGDGPCGVGWNTGFGARKSNKKTSARGPTQLMNTDHERLRHICARRISNAKESISQSPPSIRRE